MIKLELLQDIESQELAGGNGGWAFPSLTSKTSTMEINNLIQQSNVGSAWASSATASGGGGWGHWFHKTPSGGSSSATATNTQKNYNTVTNFGFSFTI
jgi:hypothetical protein